MSQKVQKLFSQISGKYDFLNHVLSLNIDKSWRKKTIKEIKKNPNDHFLALDLCCGTFDLTIECLKQYHQAEVIALDFAYPMLTSGKNKILKKDQDRVQIVCGDALRLPLGENSVDVIFCGFGYRNLDDTEAGLKEMYRVLKPGGKLLILEFFKPTTFLSKAFHGTYNQIMLPTMGRLIANNKEAYEYLRDSISGFETIDQTKNLFSKTGFKNIRSRDLLFKISSLVMGEKNV
jgi:demethylmenaquinone methyltransferase/2-methoxy-6-polyprenyl-1,4-benzoquinol methylase